MRIFITFFLPVLVLAGRIPDFYDRQDETKTFNSLSISAFNIQIFGQAKMDKPEVVEVLVDILVQYDMTLIQEIRDSAQTAIIELLDAVNAQSGGQYEYIQSERLGSTSSKEQYAFFYKPSIFSVAHEYQYPINYNMFERSPYIVTFNAPGYDINQFAYMAIHVKPDEAPREIDFLLDVYDESTASNGGPVPTDDWILGGDFNADCSYVTESEWENIRLRHDPRFNWVIGDDVDTTLSPTSCAYDRFVLTGRVSTSLIGGSAVAYDFRADMGLDNELALDTSDHFPVELRLD